jgi:hypothetical protein
VFEAKIFMFLFTEHRPVMENSYKVNVNKMFPAVQVSGNTSARTDMQIGRRRSKLSKGERK